LHLQYSSTIEESEHGDWEAVDGLTDRIHRP